MSETPDPADVRAVQDALELPGTVRIFPSHRFRCLVHFDPEARCSCGSASKADALCAALVGLAASRPLELWESVAALAAPEGELGRALAHRLDREFVQELAAEPCEYRDGCPREARHYRCRACKARDAMAGTARSFSRRS